MVGEMSLRQSNDFSKIQARFANRMKLTSADVAEVIQKRLLMKNDKGVDLLSGIYHSEANNFKTLFDFSDGSQTYRNFQDQDHFIFSYPFIPYQFALFQSAIQNLSQHSAFEGKHSSVGERSMLGVFQQVAIQIGGNEIGGLATFDLMFEGIRTALKSNIQRAILQSEKHLDSPFAIRILKALFLVKYVKEFKPSLRNLCVLMLDRFNQSLPQLRKKVEEALNLLEQQTYIQRNGELYEFLTDEEKDVEQEIKNTEVESNDVASELDKIFFDHIIKSRKIRYDNGQDYPYSRKLDDRLHGREYELAIHVITPFYENADNEFILQSHTMGRDELLVVLPADDRLVRDILIYKRTEKYIRQNISVTQQEAVKRILTDKGFQNRERYADLQQHIRSLLVKAKLYVSGSQIEGKGDAPQARITYGFHELITRTYPNLRMLRGIAYTENDIAKCLKQSRDSLFGTDATALEESEQEMLAFIQSNQRGGVRTTLKNLVERFERKPYGWQYAAILCTLAKLCARGKIEVRADGNILEEDDLERALRNTHGHGNVVLEPQVDFTASQVRALKEFYEDFFDGPPAAAEAKALGKETGVALQKMKDELASLAVQSHRYPFLNALTPLLEQLKALGGKPYTWYLTELLRQEDALLDLKETVVDPVRRFMGGPQKGIFDNARKFFKDQEHNFAYIDGDESVRIVVTLADPQCFKGNHMQQVKTLVDTLQEKVTAQIRAEITKARGAVKALKDRLCGMAEFAALPPERQEELIRPFTEASEAVERQTLIAVVRDNRRHFEETDYPRLLSKMAAWAPSASEVAAPSGRNKQTTSFKPETESVNGTQEPRVQYVPSRSIRVSFDKAWLADEVDVERYLECLREALLAEIRCGKRIQI